MRDRAATRERWVEETLETIRSVDVEGKRRGRTVVCPYCNETLPRSVIPHLKKRHKAKWQEWREVIHRLRLEGLSPKEIMKEMNTLFSWTVIERELLELAEEKDRPLVSKPVEKVRKWAPDDDERPHTTLWSFPSRGNWAVHSSDYRGNWSPYIPRFTIREYTQPGDLVLDPMVGGGTTLIECRLLGRSCIAVDISPHAVAICQQKMMEFDEHAARSLVKMERTGYLVLRGDARGLPVRDESVDMICTHPPYGPAIRYTAKVEGDLSRLPLNRFSTAIEDVVGEFKRVLKPGKHCVILIGDYRSGKTVEPLGFEVFDLFKGGGFTPQEIIIKAQYQDSSTGFYFGKPEVLPFRIGHEYLLVFKKPE